MKIEVTITPHIWLQASPQARNLLSKEFGMTRSQSPKVTNERGIVRVETDGYTVNDLKKINVETMQRYLGFDSFDPNANLIALFQLCVDKADGKLAPPKETPKEAASRFCEHCDSKGVKHKKDCKRNEINQESTN